jgi:uncharacterized protein (TIGR00251 family)
MASKQGSKSGARAGSAKADSAKADASVPAKAARISTGDTFFGWDGDVLVLNVLGKPSASKDAIGKPKGTQLKISVTAAPRDGKATDHMLRFLAPLFGVAVSDIVVVFGQENVNKQLRIHAPKKLPAVFTEAAPFAD